MDYASLLIRAATLTWRNRVLWLFGIMAGLMAGWFIGGSNIDLEATLPAPEDMVVVEAAPTEDLPLFAPTATPTPAPTASPDAEAVAAAEPPILFIERSLEDNLRLFLDNVPAPTLAAVALALVMVGIVVWGASVIGVGALIGGVQQAAAGRPPTFADAWDAGVEHFGRVAVIGIISGVVLLLGFLVVLAPATSGSGFLTLCFAPFFLVGAIGFYIWQFFATLSAVTQKQDVLTAFGESAVVLRANLGPVAILGVIMLLVNGLFGAVVTVPLFGALLTMVVGLLSNVLLDIAVGMNALLAFGGLFLLCLAPFLLVLNGIGQTWLYAVWTQAYEAMRDAAGR